jgi:hypothetical protein
MGSENIKNDVDTHVQNTYVVDDDFPHHGSMVDAKYMGTVTDQHEMSILGKTQVLRVRMRRFQLSISRPH